MAVGQIPDSLRGTAIILAAGASVRFGSDKKNLPFANTTLLQYTVEHYATVFSKVLVVLREQEHKLADSFPPHALMVHAPEAEFGISQSLRTGIQHAQADPWLIVGLMDMPYVKLKTLECLADRLEFTTASVVRPVYQQQYGNPIGFKQECFSQLCELSGDQGARTLLRTAKFKVETLETDDRGILIDIDTPQQLKEYDSLLR